MGAVRSDINRMRRDPGPKQLLKPKGSKIGTIPDGRSGENIFEDKFGLRAALSAGQRIARDTLKRNYTVYHFVPEQVGKIASLPSMGLAPQLANPRPSHRPASKPKPR